MSVVLKPRDEKFIREHLPDAEKLLLSNDPNDILDALFMWIEIHGLDEDEFPNKKGMEAQEVYDSIYYG